MKGFLLSSFLLVVLATAFPGAGMGEKANYTGSFEDSAKIALRVKDTIERKYLALGDSYTIGQSVKPEDRFPAQAVKFLREAGIKISEPAYIATSGWTTLNLITAIKAQHPAAVYDAVSLLIGVNDQFRGMDTASYRKRFTWLLNTSVRLAGGRRRRVFVLSIPDYSVTPFVFGSYKKTVRNELNLFNAINKQVCLQHKIAYVDITPSSREAANNPQLIARDNLHFSGLEYKKWSDQLGPVMRRALEY